MKSLGKLLLGAGIGVGLGIVYYTLKETNKVEKDEIEEDVDIVENLKNYTILNSDLVIHADKEGDSIDDMDEIIEDSYNSILERRAKATEKISDNLEKIEDNLIDDENIDRDLDIIEKQLKDL